MTEPDVTITAAFPSWRKFFWSRPIPLTITVVAFTYLVFFFRAYYGFTATAGLIGCVGAAFVWGRIKGLEEGRWLTIGEIGMKTYHAAVEKVVDHELQELDDALDRMEDQSD